MNNVNFLTAIQSRDSYGVTPGVFSTLDDVLARYRGCAYPIYMGMWIEVYSVAPDGEVALIGRVDQDGMNGVYFKPSA